MVYKIPCGSCDMTYVGETGQTLDLRLREHKRALINGEPWTSAIAEHVINHRHDVAWEGPAVVDSNPPPSTNAVRLKHGRSASYLDPSTGTEDSYPPSMIP